MRENVGDEAEIGRQSKGTIPDKGIAFKVNVVQGL